MFVQIEPSSFITTLQTLFLGFLTITVPSLALYIKYRLDAAHAVAQAAADLQVVNTAKIATIETHTNGMLTTMQNKVDQQTSDATNLAQVTELKRQVASLQATQGGTSNGPYPPSNGS